MKLYYSKGACSLVIRILIHEMGLNARFESVNLQTKKTESGKDFLSINPKGYVPTLVIDNHHILTENLTIQIYLTETHHADTLLPPQENRYRYQVLEWSTFVTTELHKSFGPLFNPKISDDLKNQIFIPHLKNRFEYVEKQLAKKNYLVGDNFTLPDAYLFVMMLWTRLKKIDMQNCPELNRYFEALKTRPSIQKSLQEEGF